MHHRSVPRSSAILLLAVSLPCLAVAPESPGQELTLDTALAEAFARSPVLAAASARVEQARGRLVGARTFPYNPELEIERGERSGPTASSTDLGATLGQQIEIGGQRRLRASAAERDLESAEAGYQRLRRRVAASVGTVFIQAATAGDLADLAAAESELASELLAVTRRRFEAGAATQIDLNLAEASTARTERQAEIAGAAALEAQSLLAEEVGLDPAAPPRPARPIELPAGEPAPLAELIAGALERRADLKELHRAREAAEARLRLARAGRAPDLTVAAFYREEEQDRIVGGGIGIALPLWNRKRGEIAEASADIDAISADQVAQELAVRREVFAALARYRAAHRAAEMLGEQTVGSLTESLELLERSFSAGKIGLSDLLIFRRELVEARRELIEATADAWTARIALDLAAGRLPGGAYDPAVSPSRKDPSSSSRTDPTETPR